MEDDDCSAGRRAAHHRRDSEKGAAAGCDHLPAALPAQEQRSPMAKHCRRAGEHACEVRDDECRHERRDEPLRRIEHDHRQAQPPSEQAPDVASADVAAAVEADVVSLDEPDEPVAPRHRAEHVARSDEVLEVNLVILDSADRKGEIELERSDLRVDLIGARGVDVVELAEDLVPLVDVALVELVMRLDRRPRDAVKLVQLGLQLPWRDLLEFERERRHDFPLSTWAGGGSISSLPKRERSDRCPTRSPRCPTTTTRSSRTSTSRRCAFITTSTTRPTSTTPTRRSRGPSGRTGRSRRCSRSSTCFRRTSGLPRATTSAATRTTASSGRSWARTGAVSRAGHSALRSNPPSGASTSSRPPSTTPASSASAPAGRG